ncbi:MAG: sugar ABC transporter substrate-binding protein, partial [Euzebyales bacterium]|nr:sugar ABC transporter substrate-binding protein [Euzebyales bacterium]
PNQGQVSQWVQGMNQAITAKPDIIVLNTAPDPRVLQPQLRAAKAAGIPVLVTHFHDDSSPPPPQCEGCAAGVSALVSAPFYVAGAAAANWIIADSKGDNHTLIVGANDALPSPGTVETVQKTFADNCGDTCRTSFVNVPIPDWNTKVQSEVQSALNRDPSINYVYVLYDAMVSGAVPAVQTTGKAGQVKVVSYNGSPFALKFIQDGDIMAMDVGEDTVGIGYTNMDQAFRMLTGMDTVETRTPIRIFDDSNVEEAGKPPEPGVGYGNELAEGFTELWGLK